MLWKKVKISIIRKKVPELRWSRSEEKKILKRSSSFFPATRETCPSQKLIRGKFVEKIFSSVQRLNEISTVQFIWKDGFNVKFLIEVDSEHRSAKIVRCFWYQNDLSFQAAFFHSYRWCNPPIRGKSIILHLPTGLGWIGRPLGVFFPRLKCVLSLW